MNPTWTSKCGRVELYLGDCFEIVPTLEGIDAVITDPPYDDESTHKKHLSSVILKKGHTRKALKFSGIDLQTCVMLAETWTKLALRWVVFTCEWKFAHALDSAGILVRLGIWRKPDGAPQFTGDRPGTGWEAVAICHRSGKKHWNGGGSHAFWTFGKAQGDSGHPTEKPLLLFLDFVHKFTDSKEWVLDPFMGSGTTGVACIRTGRKFIGIEIDPKHFQTAKERIQDELRNPSLFKTVAPPKPRPVINLF